jgi:hypothetical protein
MGEKTKSQKRKETGLEKGVYPESSTILDNSSSPMTHNNDFLPIYFTESEKQDIRDLAEANPSFYKNVLQLKINLTDQIKDELRNIMYGKIPRNFIINIKNAIGSPIGVFKSTFALQAFCLILDPTFTVKERVAFTANQLNDLIKANATRKQIFVLDERVHDLKQSAELRLANIAESCRERQICLVLVGVAEKFLNISHYHFERFGESNDDYLPNKTVYFVVKKITDTRKIYRGYVKHNVTPLTDEVWRKNWEDYMKLKSEHQEKVIQQQTTGFDFIKQAEGIIIKYKDDILSGGFINSKGTLSNALFRNLIYKDMPDITNDERKMILVELISNEDKYIKLLTQSFNENNVSTK